MFDMSWSELLLIAVVALIVIGPKDLPKVLKTFAQFARKAREMAREFQSGLEEMAREAELHEVKKEIEKTVSTDLAGELEHSIDPGGTIAQSLDIESLDTKSLDLQAEAAAGAASAPVEEPPSVTVEEPAAEPAAAPAAAPVAESAASTQPAPELAESAAPATKP